MSIPTNPQAEPLAGVPDIQAIEADAIERLRPWWAYAELAEPSYPIETATVVDLLDRVGYIISNDLVLGWLNQKLIHTPPRVNGRLVWFARQILMLAVQLESWRRWKPFHPLQRPKLNQFEMLQADAEAAGFETCFHDLERFDVHSLLVMMEGSDSLPVRQAMRVAILSKLKAGETL